VKIGFTSTANDRQMRFAEQQVMFDQSTNGFVMTARFADHKKMSIRLHLLTGEAGWLHIDCVS
jgi:hypothetical protein